LRELAAKLATDGISEEEAKGLTQPEAYDTTYEFLLEDAALFQSMGVTKDIFDENFNERENTRISFEILAEKNKRSIPGDVYTEFIGDTKSDKISKLNLNHWISLFSTKTNVTIDEFAHGL